MQYWTSAEKYPKEAMVQHDNKLYRSLIADNIGNIPNAAGSTSWSLYVDPISQVYTALWSMVEAHTPLASMVKTKNRIKYNGDNRDPEKREILDADMPEIRIISSTSNPTIGRTSNGTSVVKHFKVQISTGDQRVDAGLFAIEWELYRAFANWANTMKNLTWNSKTYILKAVPTAVQDGMSNNELQRGIRGWISIWECEVEMWFTTADMILT